MVVTIDQTRIGVKKYLENEIAYKATGLTKFAIYFAIPSIDNNVIKYINKAKESILFSDIFNENGDILIDDAYERAVFAAEKSGKVFIDKLGLALDKSDVEKIFKYIKES